MLDGFNLHQMRRVLSLSRPYRLLEPVETIQSQLVSSWSEELGDVRQEGGATGKYASQQPHEFPTTLFTGPEKGDTAVELKQTKNIKKWHKTSFLFAMQKHF